MLVVEDNAMNRLLVHDILETAGYDVMEAASVPEGRACIAEVLPDIVIMDIQLPAGGGETLLRELHQDPRTAKIPVLAVTAFAMDGDKERLLAAGFDAYISKPIDIRSFVKTVAIFLSGDGRPNCDDEG